jgi:aminoglycoside phosphotransferase (APT) family kinase protein
MHADELSIDAELVRRLLAGQFPRWAELPIEPVPSAGTDNALYRLGDDLSVRLPRIRGATADVDRAHRWLPRLAPLLPVAIPEPLGRGEPAEGYPWRWSVYRWLDGENPVVGQLADPRALVAELARFITALRGIDPTDAPLSGRGEPLRERDAPTRTAIDAVRGMVDNDIDIDAVTAAWDSALHAPTWGGPLVWIHGDLSPGNLLVVANRLGAVIDCGGVGLGDPACDLVIAWNLLPASVRDDFRTAVGIDDAAWARGRGWALSIALIQLPYYHATNLPLAANSRHVISEVVADHRRTVR